MSAPGTEWYAWSDGSSLSNPGPAGWAIYVRRPDGSAFTKHGSSDRARTNNEAELFALEQAIKAIPEGEPAVVYADSQYALKAATEWRRTAWIARGLRTAGGKPVANVDMLHRLWAAVDAKPLVRLEWTKGHADDEGNQRVDTLARTAAEAFKAKGQRIMTITQEL